MKKFKLSLLALSIGAALTLAACGSKTASTQSGSSETKLATSESETASESKETGAAKKTIKYGKSQGPYTELFETAIVPILEKEGYKLEAVEFSDLLTADIALNDGDVDVNVEQHTAYAQNFNANYNGDLTPISVIPTVPAGIYSSTHTSLDEIKDGAKIAIPNDASNTSRAYLLLEKIGFVKIDENADKTKITKDDIVENPYNIDFVEMKSLTIPAAMQDFDYVVITGSIVYNAGIDPASALANEDILEHLLLQVVVKKDNASSDWAKAIVDAYHSSEFLSYLDENNNGLWYVPDALRE